MVYSCDREIFPFWLSTFDKNKSEVPAWCFCEQTEQENNVVYIMM
jgi:hypothetical protein